MKSISEINDQKLMSMSQDLHDVRKELRAITKQLNQYKSIVKTVDPDNLPEGEVFIDFFDCLLIGQMGLDKFKNILFVYGDGTKIIEVRKGCKYIEQKDLIKLFEDSK